MNVYHLALFVGTAVYVVGYMLCRRWESRHDGTCRCERCEWVRLKAAVRRATADERRRVCL